MPITEKRRHLRFETDINGEFNVCGSDVQGLLKANNFSRSGFRAIFNQKPEQNSLVQCELTFPQSIMPFFLTARVIWVKTTDLNSGINFEAGLQLHEFDAIERQYFLDVCYENLNKAKDVPLSSEFPQDY